MSVPTDLQRLAADAAGLPAPLANRLQGETVAELAADAEAFARSIGAAAPSAAPRQTGSGFDGGQRGVTPRAPYTADEIRALARSNPDEFNRLVDEGLIGGIR